MFVVFIETCPNYERIVFISTPDSNKWVTVECLIVCGLTFFLGMLSINSAAFAAYLVNISYIPNLVIGLQYLLRNTASSLDYVEKLFEDGH